MIKVGTRLQSQACDTQVVVIATSDALDDLRCGGAEMVEIGTPAAEAVAIDGTFADGTLLGKRYVHGGAEVLVTKAGAGSLSVGSAVLGVKESAALPASD